MTTGSSIQYRLRQNKAVDRELFLSLLVRLRAHYRLQDYRYIGLGGPFMEDFRLIHSRLGISKMTCIELDPETHKRQIFNMPISSIECENCTLEEYLDANYIDEPAIIWFDYTDPKNLAEQIQRFSTTLGSIPLGSVLRITLNANPPSLGTPDPKDVGTGAANDNRLTVPQWRLEKLREKLGDLFPAELKSEGVSYKNYGKSLLRALELAVEKEALNHLDRKLVWALATHYADGQPMVTGAIVVADIGDDRAEQIISEWEYVSRPADPHQLDLPSLSTLERLTLEAKNGEAGVVGFKFPRSDLGCDPLDAFRKFYRVFPHFSRVEL